MRMGRNRQQVLATGAGRRRNKIQNRQEKTPKHLALLACWLNVVEVWMAR